MNMFVRVILVIFAIWIWNHPNTQALIKGVSSVAVDAPIEKARSDFREEAERQARVREEARAKEIDAQLERINRGSDE